MRWRRRVAGLLVVGSLSLALAATIGDGPGDLDPAGWILDGVGGWNEPDATRFDAADVPSDRPIDDAFPLRAPTLSIDADARPTAPPVELDARRIIDRPTAPGIPRQLLSSGCCRNAWWSADSTRLNYLDRPEAAQTAGIYGVPVWPPGASPTVIDTSAGAASGADRLLVRAEDGQGFVRDMVTGEEWPIPSEGNPVRIAPDGQRLVWWDSWGGRRDIDSLIGVHTATVRGDDPRELVALYGATVTAFLPDSRHVLVVGRPFRERPLNVLVRVDTVDGEMVELARGEWLSDALVSPDGGWVAWMTSLDRVRPERNGVWAVSTEADAFGEAIRLAETGAYRWRDRGKLAFVEMKPGQDFHEVIEIDVASGERRVLVGADVGLKIAGNDWSISPDGASLAWVDAKDDNLWVIDLP